MTDLPISITGEILMAIHNPRGESETCPAVTTQSLRTMMLEFIAELEREEPFRLQAGTVLREVLHRCQDDTAETQKTLLTIWHDLFRTGYLAPGFNFDNAELPFFHVTTQGRESLKQLSRDPSNPDGYFAYLRSRSSLDDVSRSYVEEAVHSYNAACFKAAAVMVGGAAESLVLRMRDKLVANISSAGGSPPAGMNDWRIKTVRDAITSHLSSERSSMPRELKEAFDAYWSGFGEQIRRVRNDAGHPTSVDPVTPESVQASLLIFPELAHLISELESWAGQP